MKKEFNIIINGVGGQGLITLLKIISEAALKERYALKTSELHGLSQRGGSVEAHIRFGPKIHSPLVPFGKANLILSLENQEVLNGLYYSGKETTFLINKYQTPTFSKDFSEKEITKILKKNFHKKIFLIPASEICQKKLGNEVVSGIYLLGFAVFKKIIPLKSKSISEAIKKIIPEKFLELNKKAFQLGNSKNSRKFK